MPVSVTMPRLGESVTEGTVTRWLKQEGERVEADEPLLEVSTDKVDTEIPSPAAGVLTRIVVGEDQTVDVGTELAVIDGGDGASAPASGGGQEAAEEAPEQQGNGRVQEEASAPPAAEEEADEPAPAPAAQVAPSSEQQGGASGGESTPITMPALGESVTEGTVTRWLKQVGEEVAVDEPLLEVSTDKVDTEIPSPVAGTLLEIVVAEDETVPVGAPLALIGSGSGSGSGGGTAAAPAPETTTEAAPAAQEAAPAAQEAAPEPEPARSPEPEPARSPEPEPARSPEPQQAAATQAPEQATPSQAPPQQAAAAPQSSAPQSSAPVATLSDEDHSAYVTPLVRKLASEHGIELSAVDGTGVGGRIRKQDILDAADAKAAAAKAEADRAEQAATAPAASAVESAAAPVVAGAPSATRAAPVAVSAAAAALRGKTEKLSRLRKVIATRMVESLQTSAQLTTVVEVDVTRIARLRQRAKGDFEARHGVKLSFLPFFALAAVEALQAHPAVNSTLDMEAGTVTYHDAEHLGMAVDTDRGLLVPVIHDAGDLNLAGMARRIADLAVRTRENKVSPDELGGGTFTLTNTGSRGALFDTPIINQPQSAILGTGAVVKRAVVVDDPDLGELITPRSMVYLALSYDHRIVDGADAARFLATMKERLEGGAFEGELGLA
jgi:pyruvate dehydrogenase E2 component (dihydrolipoamide acetyltransferase)